MTPAERDCNNKFYYQVSVKLIEWTLITPYDLIANVSDN